MRTKAIVFALILSVLAVLPAVGDDSAKAATGQKTTTETTYYIEVVATVNNVNGTEQVTVNYGRLLPSLLGIRTTDMQNAARQATFNSSVDALNYMAQRGWTLASSYSVSGRTATTNHFVMSITTDDTSKVISSILNPEK